MEEVRKRGKDGGWSETALGPISYLIVEIPGNKMTGEGFAALLDLVDNGTIRILDLMFVTHDTDGSVRAIDLQDLDSDGQFDLAVFAGASSGLLSESDLRSGFGDRAGLSCWNPDLRKSMGYLVRPGAPPHHAELVLLATSRKRSWRLLSTPLAADRRKDGHATTSRNRTNGGHRRNGYGGVESRLTTTAEPLGPARGSAVCAAAIRPPTPVHAAGSAACSRSIAQLKDLAELKSQGILTDAEFQAQKARVLGS